MNRCPSPSSDCQVKCGLESCAEEESKMTGKSCQRKGVQALAHYVDMRTKQPLLNLGASVHSIHLGTEFAAEITFFDIADAVNAHAALLSRAEQDAKRIEELEAALRCISTPADVSKMKARIEELEGIMRELLALPVAIGELRLLDRGIGTISRNAVWSRLRALQRGGA